MTSSNATDNVNDTNDTNTDIEADESLGELVDALEAVDETSEDAEQNATTISDNNGSRIELDPKLQHKPLPTTQSVLNQGDVIKLVPRRKDKIILVKKKPSK